MAQFRFPIKASALLGAATALFVFARAGALAVKHLTVERTAPIYMQCSSLTSTGEGTPKGKGWIELESFLMGGGSNPSSYSGAGGGAGKVAVHDISVTKRVDTTSSPLLMRAVVNGQHDRSCTMDLDKPGQNGGQEYLQFTMENVYVTKYNQFGGGENTNAQERFTLNFEKIEYKYKPQTSSDRFQTTIGPPGSLVKPSPTPTVTPKPPVVH